MSKIFTSLTFTSDLLAPPGDIDPETFAHFHCLSAKTSMFRP